MVVPKFYLLVPQEMLTNQKNLRSPGVNKPAQFCLTLSSPNSHDSGHPFMLYISRNSCYIKCFGNYCSRTNRRFDFYLCTIISYTCYPQSLFGFKIHLNSFINLSTHLFNNIHRSLISHGTHAGYQGYRNELYSLCL